MRKGALGTGPSIALLAICAAIRAFGMPGNEDSPVDLILQKTGELVGRFWDEVPSYDCTESVSQEKIGKNGKIEFQQDSVFDYLAITKREDGDLTMDEVRLPLGVKPGKPHKPSLLSTNGFPTLLLVFHPLHQPNYHFWMETASATDGAVKVRFEHIPGTRSTSALMIQERIYPLDLQGTASIDPGTGAIRGISASLMAPMREINVEKFKVEVTYRLQSFPSDSSRWLPSRSLIEIQTALQHWRNIHYYSQYKRFSVQSVERTAK